MKRIFRLGIVFFLAVLSVAVSHAETARMFFKLDGIKGESADVGHHEWIDVLTCSRSHTHGAAQTVQTGSPDAAGSGVYEPFAFTHVVDKATPKLHEACMKGTHIKTAELHCCRQIAGVDSVAYKVTIEGVKVVKAQVEVKDLSDGTFQLVEEVRLLCARVTEEVVAPQVPVDVFLPVLPDHLSAGWTSSTRPEPQPITNSTFTVAPGTTNVVIHFAADEGYMLLGAESLYLGAPSANVSVSPEDIPDVAVAATVACRVWTGTEFTELTTNAAVVSAETARLVGGYWYVALGGG